MMDFKLAVLGPSGGGKSSFIIRFVHDEFNEGCEYALRYFCTKTEAIDGKFYNLEFVESESHDYQPSFEGLKVKYADGILLLFSVTDIRSFRINQLLEHVLKKTRNLNGSYQVPVVLVATKIDLKIPTASLMETWSLAKRLDIPLVATSSITGVGIANAVHCLVREIKKKKKQDEGYRGDQEAKAGKSNSGSAQVPPDIEELRPRIRPNMDENDSGETACCEKTGSHCKKLNCSVS